ncbi:MAG: hypothetical protein ACJ759_18335 [Thermoanaerobaculia bacterium]
MIVDLPLPPAPVTARIEAVFHAPAAPPYAHLWAREGEALPEVVPVRQLQRRKVGSTLGTYALANPINDVLDRLGYPFRTLLQEIRSWQVIQRPVSGSSLGVEPDGFGDPVPPGDPIPVDGGGKPIGG